MYRVRINYGIENTTQIFIKEKELKKAFKTEDNLNKFINKIKKEVQDVAKSNV